MKYSFVISHSFSLGYADCNCIPNVGNSIENTSSGQVHQYEKSTCFVHNKCKYEEYHESYVKLDAVKLERFNGKDESGFALISSQQDYGVSHLGERHGSFKGIKEYKHELGEKTEDNAVKLGFPLVLPPRLSSSDKIANRSSKSLRCQKMQSAIFRLSFKRRSCDGEETTEHGKF